MWTEITRPKYEREGQRYASDQVGALNGRLPLGGGGQDLHRIVGETYSAPARMPVGQRAVTVLRRV